jgi:hypothetical protein
MKKQTHEQNSAFAKEEIQMAKKNIKKMHTKTTLRLHLTPV